MSEFKYETPEEWLKRIPEAQLDYTTSLHSMDDVVDPSVDGTSLYQRQQNMALTREDMMRDIQTVEAVKEMGVSASPIKAGALMGMPELKPFVKEIVKEGYGGAPVSPRGKVTDIIRSISTPIQFDDANAAVRPTDYSNEINDLRRSLMLKHSIDNTK